MGFIENYCREFMQRQGRQSLQESTSYIGGWNIIGYVWIDTDIDNAYYIKDMR